MGGEDTTTSSRERRWPAAAAATLLGRSPRGQLVFTLALLAAAAAALLLPGATFVRTMLQDALVLLDGGYRIAAGQLPHVDFHTPIGAVAPALARVALALTGSPGPALTAASLAGGGLLALGAWVLLKPRLANLHYAAVLAVLVAVVTVPLNVGDHPRWVSYAMWYNRLGWAGLLLLFLLYVPRWSTLGSGMAAGRATSGGGVDGGGAASSSGAAGNGAAPAPGQGSGGAPGLSEGLAAGLLLAFLLYTKITYFAVGLGFVALLALFHRAWRVPAAAGVAVVTACAGLVSFLLPGLNAGYAADLRRALEASGAVAGDAASFGYTVVLNGAELLVACLGLGFFLLDGGPFRSDRRLPEESPPPAGGPVGGPGGPPGDGAVLHAGRRFRADRRLRAAAVLAYMAAASLLLMDQNNQSTGLVAILAALVWVSERSVRRALAADAGTEPVAGGGGEDAPDAGGGGATEGRIRQGPGVLRQVAAPVVLVLVFAAPYLFDALGAAYYNLRGARSPANRVEGSVAFRDLRVHGAALPLLETDAVGRAPVDEGRFYRFREARRPQPLFQREYLETFLTGAELLRRSAGAGERVVVLDMVNPLSLLTRRSPPSGDELSFYAHRSFGPGPAAHIPAAELFAGTELVMVPAFPADRPTRDLLLEVYGPYLRAHFADVTRTRYWRLLRKESSGP